MLGFFQNGLYLRSRFPTLSGGGGFVPEPLPEGYYYIVDNEGNILLDAQGRPLYTEEEV